MLRCLKINLAAVGDSALQNNTSGTGNTALGISAGSGVTTANSVICIGAAGANVAVVSLVTFVT
jgi:hypothetical protein